MKMIYQQILALATIILCIVLVPLLGLEKDFVSTGANVIIFIIKALAPPVIIGLMGWFVLRFCRSQKTTKGHGKN